VDRERASQQEPGSARALLSAVLCVVLILQLLAAAVLPPLLAYAVPSFLMPFTCGVVLTDGWLQKQILALAARIEGRRRDGFQAFLHAQRG
jgi:hypothetical protein